jgi:hypothetical protein
MFYVVWVFRRISLDVVNWEGGKETIELWVRRRTCALFRRISYMLRVYELQMKLALCYINAFAVKFPCFDRVRERRGNGSIVSEEITEHIAPSTTTITTLAASARRWSLTAVTAPRIFGLAPGV